MNNFLVDTKKLVYRWIKYRLVRPEPPPSPFRFTGPAVVVGSAPVSHCPAGMDDSFSVITVNGSQSITSQWGIEVPDITMMMFNQIEGTTHNAREVRRVLSGRRTRALFVLLWRKNERERLERGLASFNYRYDHLYIVDRYERMALLDKVAGLRSLEIDAESKCSNGVNAVLFALYHGAPAVIITGINPNSSGHAYNDAGLSRLHVRMDTIILRRLLEAGRPIYTADPEVARETGIPLWNAALTETLPAKAAPATDI
ncbi:membrane-anchored protein [Pigmentiphaga sp. NML080357]|uniref:membrane-anchored protein n=1 Tax=Pigmentiphaga sp. NML080357 TaxID=2008675 RepID=UPI000B40A197|nr:membrane-anchored protein [Pigmentiphaga sp. NML080357]OVZ62827.1 membrane-anchored protein [Pigmentiphaga sp. NML080357]